MSKEEFLKRLTELTRESGWVIGGCGCCGSPFLLEYGLDEVKDGNEYQVSDNDDNLSWKKP